jgi:hypothetical protein
VTPSIAFILGALSLVLVGLLRKGPTKPGFRRFGRHVFRERETKVEKVTGGDLIALGCLIVVAVSCVVVGVNGWRELRGLESAPATLHGVDVVQKVGRRKLMSSPRYYYVPWAVFSFELGGRRYTSERVSNATKTASTAPAAREFIAGLEAPSLITVYIPRGHPEKAFIVKDEMHWRWMLAIGVIASMIVGVVIRRMARSYGEWQKTPRKESRVSSM